MPEAASSQPSAASTEATGAGGRGRRRRKNGASRSLSPAPPGAPETSTSPAGTGKASTSNSRAPTPPRAQSPSPQAKLLWDGFPDEFADYPNGQRSVNALSAMPMSAAWCAWAAIYPVLTWTVSRTVLRVRAWLHRRRTTAHMSALSLCLLTLASQMPVSECVQLGCEASGQARVHVCCCYTQGVQYLDQGDVSCGPQQDVCVG